MTMKRVLNWLRRGGQATVEIGGVPQVQEEVRDIWLTGWLV
jgi:hypothetical protein